mgnify:CR=1 FL=1
MPHRNREQLAEEGVTDLLQVQRALELDSMAQVIERTIRSARASGRIRRD